MITIDKQSRIPVYEQVITQFEKLIVSGVLSEGEHIPSVRALALTLAVNPNTIQRAYLELENMGVTKSVSGVGRFVSEGAKARIESKGVKKLTELYGVIEKFQNLGVSKESILDIVDSIYGGYSND